MRDEESRGYALDLRAAFLGASAKALPGVVWRELSACEVEYPTRSPSLDRLVVAFEADKITLHVGRHHLHVPHYGGRDPADSTDRAAADVLSFILDLTRDAIVVRWVRSVSWTVRASRASGVVWRMVRHVCPGAREAVWSGRTDVR